MKVNKRFNYLSFLLVFIVSQSYANTTIDAINTKIKVDVKSMHTWRGFANSYTPTIEPSIEVSRNNSITGLWFAQSIDNSYTEFDLYFIYQLKNFSFTIFDYYCPPSIQASTEISNFNKFTTHHTIELDFAFNGTDKIPFSFLVATMIYGEDLHPETKENNYSTYIQIGYSTQLDESFIDLILGFNAFESYYGEKFGVINAGITATRNLKAFKSKEIPVQASLITNPMNNSLYLTFGFTL